MTKINDFDAEVIDDSVVLDESRMIDVTGEVKLHALTNELKERNAHTSVAWKRRLYEAEHPMSSLDELKGMFMGIAIKAFS